MHCTECANTHTIPEFISKRRYKKLKHSEAFITHQQVYIFSRHVQVFRTINLNFLSSNLWIFSCLLLCLIFFTNIQYQCLTSFLRVRKSAKGVLSVSSTPLRPSSGRDFCPMVGLLACFRLHSSLT